MRIMTIKILEKPNNLSFYLRLNHDPIQMNFGKNFKIEDNTHHNKSLNSFKILNILIINIL